MHTGREWLYPPAGHVPPAPCRCRPRGGVAGPSPARRGRRRAPRPDACRGRARGRLQAGGVSQALDALRDQRGRPMMEAAFAGVASLPKLVRQHRAYFTFATLTLAWPSASISSSSPSSTRCGCGRCRSPTPIASSASFPRSSGSRGSTGRSSRSCVRTRSRRLPATRSTTTSGDWGAGASPRRQRPRGRDAGCDGRCFGLLGVPVRGGISPASTTAPAPSRLQSSATGCGHGSSAVAPTSSARSFPPDRFGPHRRDRAGEVRGARRGGARMSGFPARSCRGRAGPSKTASL